MNVVNQTLRKKSDTPTNKGNVLFKRTGPNTFTLAELTSAFEGAMALPAINEPCGRHFRFLDLLHCSDTWKATNVPNVPVQPKTFRAMEALCQLIIDPVIDEFGHLKLTHGFCSKASGTQNSKVELHRSSTNTRDIELSRSGQLICPARWVRSRSSSRTVLVSLSRRKVDR